MDSISGVFGASGASGGGAATEGGGLGSLFGAAGSIFEAIGEVQRGREERKLAEYNARVSEYNAAAETEASRRDMAALDREKQRAMSQLMARAAAQGFTLDSDAPLLMLSEQVTEFERARSDLKYNSQVRQQQLRSDANLSRYQGSLAESAGYGSAGGKLFKSAVSTYKPKPKTDSKDLKVWGYM